MGITEAEVFRSRKSFMTASRIADTSPNFRELKSKTKSIGLTMIEAMKETIFAGSLRERIKEIGETQLKSLNYFTSNVRPSSAPDAD